MIYNVYNNRIFAGVTLWGMLCWSTQMTILVAFSTGRPRSYSSLARRQRRFFMSKTEEIRTLAPGSRVTEYEMKKSRFLAYAKHPKARHWCYGYRGGTDPVTERCSDDGEPTGTAGLPILGAIQGEFLSDTICIVVRYFGGVKLGAGGLIRAYGASARQTLREAPILVLTPKITVHVKVPASFVGVVYELAAKCGGQTSNDEYGVDGTLSIDITCEKENEVRLREELQDATRGTAEIQ